MRREQTQTLQAPLRHFLRVAAAAIHVLHSCGAIPRYFADAQTGNVSSCGVLIASAASRQTTST